LKEGKQMNKWKYLSNNRGFTLIEILVSVVILSIVLTIFMSIFAQSALYQKNNELKLSVSQTAQKIVTLIDLNVNKKKLTDASILDSNLSGTITNADSRFSTLLEAQIDDPYLITISFNKLLVEDITYIKATVTVTANSKIKTESTTYTFVKG
jgi:prepilin-type N-terminal cleavage/methylation domain-containing protein